ncbi:MAG TPA: hypothetical protein VG737_14225 [Cyclobacteriaceae bacterium]|nr:hypothetical protein [Cyclobacteriaceae bacterium]
MTRSRIIFYSIFGVYQLMAFIFTLYIEKIALSLVHYLSWFKYITFLGLVMIIADFVWLWMDQRKYKKTEEASRHENNVLKAKVYDLQQGTAPTPEVPKVK